MHITRFEFDEPVLFVSSVTLSSSRIGLLREVTHHLKKLLVFLADEEPVGHEAVKRGHGARILRRARTNNRDGREVFVEEVSRFGHD